MRGTLGLGADLTMLPEEELTNYARKIAFYKKIRHIVQGGDLYRLKIEPGVSVWQTVLPDGTESVYSIAVTNHKLGIQRAPSKLRGLNSDALYVVTDENNVELGRWSGFQLATLGLPGDTVFGGAGQSTRSRTLLVKKV
jgi:alpha-galactosidase